MRKDDISRLLERYLSMQKEGKDPYFDADEIEDLLDSFEESDDFTLYEEILQLGMKQHPNHPGLQIKRCKLLVYNEEYKKALKLIDSITDIDEPELDLLRLECYYSLNKCAEAKAFVEKLIRSDCDYLEDVFEYIAPVLGELGMHETALDFIRTGQQYFPDNIVLKEELCFNLESAGQIKEAIEVCNELIDNNPYSFEDWTTLGRLYSIQEEYDKAIEAFDFALTCDETDCETKILKAYCLFMNENYHKAIEVYSELTNNEQYKYRVMPLMAECYLRLDEYETAYGLLHEALENNKQYEEPASYINYLLCCAKTGRLEEEEKILEKALKLFPDHINLLYLKALYYTEKGREDEAIRTLAYILEHVKPEDTYINNFTDTHFQLANLFLKKGDIENALKHYLQVIDLIPTFPMVHLKTAICYLKLGDTQKFMDHITQCTDEEIIEFEGDYIPSDPEQNKSPLIDLIKEYVNKKKEK
ncbi:MAG: tetratricopeptide repeat protein [Parabacteroides sp.]|nr:tetratricopeptide repeat protein [Parabacteroides sp.]